MSDTQTVEVDASGSCGGLLVGRLYDVVMDFVLGLADTTVVVQDAAGCPLPNAQVLVWLEGESEDDARRLTTDADGAVQIDDLDEDAKLYLRVLARGTPQPQPTQSPTQSTFQSQSQATKSETRLLVQDAAGRPLPKVKVRVWFEGESESAARTLTTDASGALRVKDCPPGAGLSVRLLDEGTPHPQPGQ